MNAAYCLKHPETVFSPSLLFYKDLIRRNIARTVEIAGDPSRLRPHVKTHKTREIARMQLAAGITKQKCATIAEAEMLATCEIPDVLIAYPIVGPNCQRVAKLARKFPKTRFGVLIDHPKPLQMLSSVLSGAGQNVDAYVDIDCGMHRTGIEAGEKAFALYQQMTRSPGLHPAGLHVYDGHNHQESLAERKQAVSDLLGPVLELRAKLEKAGFPVPRMVLGGTPTFPVHAECKIPGAELSPGTLSLHDYGYGHKYPELGIQPAALLLTRVISRPVGDRITLDLGYKAVSPDQPAGKRCVLLDMPEHEPLLQNEEHFVIRSPKADQFQPGDVIYALPAHICPTVALHKQALVVENGEVTERWDIVARDRELSI
ncbi:MAG TPA: D-TA family PLP-dependent enzyme [Gemmataceae bacterium]|nr:D-TA family PLP-dependent enzyme [Gemmataceae bacterium]